LRYLFPKGPFPRAEETAETICVLKPWQSATDPISSSTAAVIETLTAFFNLLEDRRQPERLTSSWRLITRLGSETPWN
jgi:hypothetical protein